MTDEAVIPTFGEWLREVLAKKDRSASWLARKMNIKPQTVAAYLSNEAHPGRDKIPLIAEALEVKEEIVWDAWRETPTSPYTEARLMRLLDLPDVMSQDELILMKHLFRALRAAEQEMEERDERSR